MAIKLRRRGLYCYGLFFVVWLLGWAFGVGSAQDVKANDLSLGVHRKTVELRNSVVLTADFIRMSREGGVVEMDARGNVELRAGGMVMRSRFLHYDASKSTLKASGAVVLDVAPYGALLTEEVVFDLEKNRLLATVVRGLFLDDHKIAVQKFEIDADGNNVSVLGGTYTICPVCNEVERASGNASIFKPIWRLRFGQIVEEDDGDTIFLRNLSFEVLGLHLPVLFFPEITVLSPEVKRQSGLLFLKGGAGASGITIGLPYFVALGESTNLLLTPYFGSKYIMMGMDVETIYENGRAEATILYKPKTGSERMISGDEITRVGIKARHYYNVNENIRWRNEIDMVSDARYIRDYGGFYNRYVPEKAPSKWRSELAHFSEQNFTQLSAGTSANLYGTTPLSSDYLEGRARYHLDVIDAEGIQMNIDALAVTESYDRSNQEVSFPHAGDADLREPKSARESLRVGLERRNRHVFPNGVVLEGTVGLRVLYRGASGDLYKGIDSYESNGFQQGRFTEIEESKVAGELKNHVKLSLPLVRYQDGERVLLSPFVAVADSWQVWGDKFSNHREEWFFPNLPSLRGSEQTPYTSGISNNLRLLVGFDGEYSQIGGKDLSFYGGFSYKASDRKNAAELDHTFDKDLLFGGVELLLGVGKAIQYKTVWNAEEGYSIADHLGVTMDFNNGITAASHYVSVSKDPAVYKGKLDLLELSGNVKLTSDLTFKGLLKKDLSGLGDYDYTVGLDYKIPCFELGVAWYTERETNRYSTDGINEDSGVRVSFNIFSMGSEQAKGSILGY